MILTRYKTTYRCRICGAVLDVLGHDAPTLSTMYAEAVMADALWEHGLRRPRCAKDPKWDMTADTSTIDSLAETSTTLEPVDP